MRRSREDRFWEKVDVREPDDCWLWSGGLNGNGYGSFNWDGSIIPASRASYLLTHGPIPTGLYVLHHCDVRTCVNPRHLYAGTAQNNATDRESRGRQTHPLSERCRAGHEWTPENTRINFKPSRNGAPARICRACDRRRAQAYRERNKRGIQT